jgi:hypothetical protein
MRVLARKIDTRGAELPAKTGRLLTTSRPGPRAAGDTGTMTR